MILGTLYQKYFCCIRVIQVTLVDDNSVILIIEYNKYICIYEYIEKTRPYSSSLLHGESL